MPSRMLSPAERARAKSRETCAAESAANSSIKRKAPTGVALVLGGEPDQVDDQRGAEQLGGGRVAVGVEVEVDDVAAAQGGGEVERLPRPEGGVEPGPELDVGEDREAVAAAAEVGLGALREPVDIGVDPLLRSALRPWRRGASRRSGSMWATSLREGRRPEPRRLHRGEHLAEQALGRHLVVGLGPAVPGERLVGDLGRAAAGERVVDRRAGRGPLEEARPPMCARPRAAAQDGVVLGVDDDPAGAGHDVGLGERGSVTVLPEPVAPVTRAWTPWL